MARRSDYFSTGETETTGSDELKTQRREVKNQDATNLESDCLTKKL
jgi:hypothetical protein